MSEIAANVSDRDAGIVEEEPPCDGDADPEEYESYCYKDDIDYLQDVRLLLNEKRKCRPSEAGLDFENRDLALLRKQIRNRRRLARKRGIRLRIDRLVEKFGLNEVQESLISGLVVEHLIGEDENRSDEKFLRTVAEEDLNRLIEVRRAFDDLKKKRLIGSPDRRLFRAKLVVDEAIFNYITEGKALPVEKFAVKQSREETHLESLRHKLETFESPRDIYRELSKYVVGQEAAKCVLAVAAFTHLASLVHAGNTINSIKQNILLVGPSGCGKTHLALTLARILDIPFTIGDATTWTEEGYVGATYDEVLWRLYENVGKDKQSAELGLVYIDEVDKLAQSTVHSNRGVGDVSVQRSLLKALEGSVVPVAPGGVHTYRASSIEIDTSNILFILGGAFVGIDDIRKRRLRRRKLGFEPKGDESEVKMGRVTHNDLVRFGMLREFVGRIPTIAEIAPLGIDDLVLILNKRATGLIARVNRDAVKYGIRFRFSAGMTRSIAVEALEAGTGARSLRGIVDRIIEPYIYKDGRVGMEKMKDIRLQ